MRLTESPHQDSAAKSFKQDSGSRHNVPVDIATRHRRTNDLTMGK
jgi:hypothetical protein